MPTLNDPTYVPSRNYYPFITMLADRLEDVLNHVTKGDFFVRAVKTQPLIPNQDAKITITHRENSTVKESTENMIRTLSRYVYEQMLREYFDCNNIEHINLDIVFEKRQDTHKEEITLFTHTGQKPTLVFNDNTTTTEDELRFGFVAGYNVRYKKWYLDTFVKDNPEKYNDWFKNYPIDFATAKLISEAKQLTETSKW